jgi:hypothetical protein
MQHLGALLTPFSTREIGIALGENARTIASLKKRLWKQQKRLQDFAGPLPINTDQNVWLEVHTKDLESIGIIFDNAPSPEALVTARDILAKHNLFLGWDIDQINTMDTIQKSKVKLIWIDLFIELKKLEERNSVIKNGLIEAQAKFKGCQRAKAIIPHLYKHEKIQKNKYSTAGWANTVGSALCKYAKMDENSDMQSVASNVLRQRFIEALGQAEAHTFFKKLGLPGISGQHPLQTRHHLLEETKDQ